MRIFASIALFTLALTFGAKAHAESLGMLRLPANIASLPSEAPIELLNPPAASTAWARPGHHPLGITLSNYSYTRPRQGLCVMYNTTVCTTT